MRSVVQGFPSRREGLNGFISVLPLHCLNTVTYIQEMNHVETIDDVIESLEKIIDWAHQENSRLGYFPALYVQVTREVQAGIQDSFFDDGPRMEKLDVEFADRYLEAFFAYRDGRHLTRSWQVTFEAAENKNLLILQHLLLGMNAHINLDLGIATARISQGSEIASVQRDFNRINEILFNLINQVQRKVDTLSPWVAVLDWVGGRKDEKFAEFSLEVAREGAWIFAKKMASSDAKQRHTSIQLRDHIVAGLEYLLEGRWFMRPIIGLVRIFESKDVRRNIEVLRTHQES